jgi:hypothetical protein
VHLLADLGEEAFTVTAHNQHHRPRSPGEVIGL